ncbi:hypothetical protein Scep_006376 [Stephania cephalantha]|uniref:Uncharacterized protein n=1 Tax=Stephania cephalantha TaxID=152367 RepID=A0AAP0K9S7_9MAGN
MGGKGQRRREKNYRAAHGGDHTARLPPPPKPTDVDALPSKLRRIIDFTARESVKVSSANDGEQKRKRKDLVNVTPQLLHLLLLSFCVVVVFFRKPGLGEEGFSEKLTNPKNKDRSNGIAQEDEHDKKKAKRKRKQGEDLRFESLTQVLGSTSTKRKERKKKYLEAKKQKNKKAKLEDADFPGHEKIKFGDIVEAPPKLSVVPKVLKTVQDASQERLRLQAVEAYRKRKGWESRPGVQLPGPVSLNTSS